MKVILVIGAQATGKTRFIQNLMESSHKDFQYRAIAHVAELQAILTDGDSVGEIFLESNTLDMDALRTTTYDFFRNDKRLSQTLLNHPQLLEVVTCRLGSAPYYYFDLPF
jgi:molybdopterin-guanine dinucleotide biosynthesis protein